MVNGEVGTEAALGEVLPLVVEVDDDDGEVADGDDTPPVALVLILSPHLSKRFCSCFIFSSLVWESTLVRIEVLSTNDSVDVELLILTEVANCC